MRSKVRPNIIFIVLDAHRRDKLGLYGSDRGASPNLDAFGGQATVFDNAVAPAQWTIPSHASMFTGQPPTAHRMVQSRDAIPATWPVLAELLQNAGYETLGFCNNPLVGVLNNGLQRGFERFYNYGGTFSEPPRIGNPTRELGPLAKVARYAMRQLRKVADYVQNRVAQEGAVLRFFLHPRLVPLWTRYANFKGDTSRSIHDVTRFLRWRASSQESRPYFLFMNLMETHLPYTPPKRFINDFAPAVAQGGEGAAFLRDYSALAAQWLLPMAEPFAPWQSRVLHQMYDAEVAYQDHCLGELLEELERPVHMENTLVIFVADHGEMLGEHQFMGHGLSVHQELVHVPLLIRQPGQVAGRRVPKAISTTRLFHTMVHAAQAKRSPDSDLFKASLLGDIADANALLWPVSEAYAPSNVIEILERRSPELIDRFRCRQTYRAVYDKGYKLVQIENAPAKVYDLTLDPGEGNPLPGDSKREVLDALQAQLTAFLMAARAQQPGEHAQQVDPLDDKAMRRRLRGLGYLN